MKKKLLDVFIQNTQMTEQKTNDRPADSLKKQEKLIFDYLQRKNSVYFNAGFADRVISRIQLIQFKQQEDFFISMVWLFKRVVLTGALAAIILFMCCLLNGPIDAQQLYYASSQVSLDELANPATAWSLEEF